MSFFLFVLMSIFLFVPMSIFLFVLMSIFFFVPMSTYFVFCFPSFRSIFADEDNFLTRSGPNYWNHLKSCADRTKYVQVSKIILLFKKENWLFWQKCCLQMKMLALFWCRNLYSVPVPVPDHFFCCLPGLIRLVVGFSLYTFYSLIEVLFYIVFYFTQFT